MTTREREMYGWLGFGVEQVRERGRDNKWMTQTGTGRGRGGREL